MKFFRIFIRSFRDSLKSIGRNFSLSIASITCVIITLIIVGAALLLSIAAQGFLFLLCLFRDIVFTQTSHTPNNFNP